MKVLIVDDSKVMRMIVARALRQSAVATFEIAEAEDGRAALDVAKSFSPDLILSDWNMPEMSGLEFLKEFRASGGGTAFGFITSETHPAIRDEALEAGANFLLTKPFSPEQFAEVVGAVTV
ncbi:MAG: two-component system, chemotaxis family, response regulator CheY [Ilumatobacteraceae bacterium]|nr:two-component system, chemotaxis family, response regulator CheY [Ilumatobacteraceae bacterium]MCU1391442.1 two-component system, chemotaxis family, response regulator CheY [Ilumatobacteraceae bacterium]